MLTPQGHVKLLDLGLARFQSAPASSDELTGAGQPMGTADYIAPEQVSDSRVVDIRADIYSLGCTLYKLLTGRAPFADSDCRGTFDKLTAHVNEPAPSIRQYDATLPDKIVDLIDRMLAKSADDRPATPAVVAKSLEPFCAGSNLIQLAAEAAANNRSHRSVADIESKPPRCPEKPPIVASSWPSTSSSGRRLWGVISAVALFSAAGGLALGVIVTIK